MSHVVPHITSGYEDKSLATSARLGASRKISHPPEAEGIPKAVPQNVVTHTRSCTAGLWVHYIRKRRELDRSLEQSREGSFNAGSWGSRNTGKEHIAVDAKKKWPFVHTHISYQRPGVAQRYVRLRSWEEIRNTSSTADALTRQQAAEPTSGELDRTDNAVLAEPRVAGHVNGAAP